MGEIAAIVLCAGQGTRMKSERSKMLHHVAGKPLCYWPIRAATLVSDNEVVAVVGFQADSVQRAIHELFDANVRFVLQAERRGTGDAVRLGLEAVSSSARSVLILCGDTPLLQEESLKLLLATQTKPGAKVVFCTAFHDSPNGYGRVKRDRDGSVLAIVEEADATQAEKEIKEINAGIYAFDSTFLREQIGALQNHNAKGEVYLTDLIEKARIQYGPEAVATCQVSKEEMIGINDRVQLSEAESLMRRRLAHYWMMQGVTMVDPNTTYIDADVKLSSDVVLHPNVILKGRTQIETGATIYSHCVIEDAIVKVGASVGPFARLRPGTVLDNETRVGNFVELKNTHMKRGAKANHLAYLGDAEIGENSNIGAGTITCNYDGYLKHKTTIKSGSFIGSNSTLVAPVVIGEQAYVGAGSTITKDVPENALAISRARQENKLGYAALIRERLKARKDAK